MIKPTIIRALTGTALVLGLVACGPIWWASDVVSFRKDTEIKFDGRRYAVRYQTNSSSITSPARCVDGQMVSNEGEVVVVEFADMGTQALLLTPLDGPRFTCADVDNWREKVYPIAAKACRAVNQTPKIVSRDRDLHVTEAGAVEIWGLCV